MPAPAGGTATAPQLQSTDFSTGRWSTIRAAQAPARRRRRSTICPPCVRAASSCSNVPRVGFFTTPAFFANWQTNTSNQMRVTINQTLIVALGAAVDGTDPTTPASTPGLDATHANTPACFACHQTLDPTRSILASTYSWNYHSQTDARVRAQNGLFAFQGVRQPVSTVADFGATLASHPLFAQAWVQKLCYYANSTACDAGRSGVPSASSASSRRRASRGTRSSRELLSSPITTNASPTKTTDDQRRGRRRRAARSPLRGAQRSPRVHRRLRARRAVREAASRRPSRRSSPACRRTATAAARSRRCCPTSRRSSIRAGTENICEAVAALVIDARAKPQAGVKQWSSAQPDAAIADFVQHRDGRSRRRIRARRRRSAAQGATSPPPPSRARARPTRSSRPSSPRAWPRRPSRLACEGEDDDDDLSSSGSPVDPLRRGRVGLRSLATGLPASFLLNPRKALADYPRGDLRLAGEGAVHHLRHLGERRPDQRQRAGHLRRPEHRPQHGPDDGADVAHARGPDDTAARPWATLPQNVLDRTRSGTS